MESALTLRRVSSLPTYLPSDRFGMDGTSIAAFQLESPDAFDDRVQEKIQQRPGPCKHIGDSGGNVPSKLNPLAEEFVPSPAADKGKNQQEAFSYEETELPIPNGTQNSEHHLRQLNPFATEYVPPINEDSTAISEALLSRRREARARHRQNHRRNLAYAKSEASRPSTVFICNIDQNVTEEDIAVLFMRQGEIVDCRLCGDPNSPLGLAFAFVEFTNRDNARQALRLTGQMLGKYPLIVKPSKTGIVPLEPSLLPLSRPEKERCSRTVYCRNVDNAADLKLFFQHYCGKVVRLRYLESYMLGHTATGTAAALVEFVTAESAHAALNLSGYLLGSFRIGVSPSKAPVWR